MEQEVSFDSKNLPRINTSLLISLIAQQQALSDLLIQHLGLPKDQTQAEIAAKAAEKMQSILGHLYTQFGMTPDILNPEKD
jgi:hypothetical protein